MLSASVTTPTSAPSGGLNSDSAPASLQNSPNPTDDDDDDDDDDDRATTPVSDDANDLACDLSQPGGPLSTSQNQSDVEDHQPAVQQAKFELDASASAAEKGGSWVNSRRRKSSRPQWHYEGTVLDKSQRLTVNGTADNDSLTAWEVDQGHGQGQTAKDTSADSDDARNEVDALSNCVTSH